MAGSEVGLSVAGPLLHESEERWGDHRLLMRLHACEALPDPALVTSVRAVVFRRGQVVVVTTPNERHIMPGGRLNSGEPLHEALKREVIEETGWRLGDPSLFAVLHFRHLTPRPPGHAYPYPDFLQPIFVAEGSAFSRKGIKRRGELETGARLMTPQAAQTVIRQDQKALLRAALAARSR